MSLPYHELFPLRGLTVTLKFTARAAPGPLHQPALTAWLRHLAGDLPGYEYTLTLDCPENGRTRYRRGDFYCFSLFAAGGESLLQALLERLQALPRGVEVADEKVPFRDNLVFVSARDVFSGETVAEAAESSAYGAAELEAEAGMWAHAEVWTLRWTAPVRLLLPADQREGRRGELRYCRHRAQVEYGLLRTRLHDSLAELLRRRGAEVGPRELGEEARACRADAFWVDFAYRNAAGEDKPMGGLLGAVHFEAVDMDEESRRLWVLGQYLGIGQRRVFGWGRYQLETAEGEYTLARARPARGLLERVVETRNLMEAYGALHSRPVGEEGRDWQGPSPVPGAEVGEVAGRRTAERYGSGSHGDRGNQIGGDLEEIDDDAPLEWLESLGRHLLRGTYEIPPLREARIPKADGTDRVLAVPPFRDRVMQRAVAQVLGPALDALMYHGSYGFRRGRSRHQAARMIQRAYDEHGCRWVFEADVDDFFDSVAWGRLHTRLLALFGEDPAVEWVMRWMQAPMENSPRPVGEGLGVRGQMPDGICNPVRDVSDSASVPVAVANRDRQRLSPVPGTEAGEAEGRRTAERYGPGSHGDRGNQMVPSPRSAGLPQGSPLSPLLSNLMLDDFDSDMELAGYRLVRFADDFVVPCETREEAEKAALLAEVSLAEAGLRLNPDKTRIATFEQGFRFLGYLFANGLALEVGGEKPADSARERREMRDTAGAVSREEDTEAVPGSEVGEVEGRRTAERYGSGSHGDRGNQMKFPPAPLFQRGEVVGDMDEAGTLVFVSGPPAVVGSGEERVNVVRAGDDNEDREILSLPWSQVRALVLVGAQHITTPALREALQRGVPVHFADSGGRYQGVTWSGAAGAADGRLWLAQQVWLGSPDNALRAAREIAAARLRHQREVLRLRNLEGRFDLALDKLGRLAGRCGGAADLEQLNGLEGQGGKIYFEALQALVPAVFGFSGRNRRPPRDPFNALLSLGYTILYAHVETVLRVSGLSPWTGFYHQPHGNHAVLASDLMEPFRHLVERAALNALNKKLLTVEDFFIDAVRGCRMRDEGRRRYLRLLSERFEEPFMAYRETEPRKLHEHLHAQNRSLAAWIGGKADTFQAWKMR